MKIVILGAYGFTGTMIAEKLARREVYPFLAGRDTQKLQELSEGLGGRNRVLPLANLEAGELKKLDFADVIVNCAGPFNLFGKPVVRYAANTGKIYLDICGEQAFVFEAFSANGYTMEKNATIVHSLAFESCMADLMASCIADPAKSYADISSFYYFENASFSRGSRYSMQAMKHFPAWIYESNQFVRARSLTLSHPVPADLPANVSALFVPYPEVIFFSKEFNTRNAGTWYLVKQEDEAYSKAAANQLPKELESLRKKYQSPASYGPEKEEREKQVFRLTVEATDENRNAKSMTVQGNDTYDLSAEIMAEAVVHVLAGSVSSKGLLTPAEFFKGKNLIPKLADACSLETSFGVLK